MSKYLVRFRPKCQRPAQPLKNATAQGSVNAQLGLGLDGRVALERQRQLLSIDEEQLHLENQFQPL